MKFIIVLHFIYTCFLKEDFMDNQSTAKMLKTAVNISRTLSALSTVSAAVTAVAAVWAVCSVLRR